MELTQAQISRIQAHIDKFSPIKCAVCGQSDKWLAKTLASTIPYQHVSDDGFLRGRTVYLLRCGNCAHVLMFDLGQLEIVD